MLVRNYSVEQSETFDAEAERKAQRQIPPSVMPGFTRPYDSDVTVNARVAAALSLHGMLNAKLITENRYPRSVHGHGDQ